MSLHVYALGKHQANRTNDSNGRRATVRTARERGVALLITLGLLALLGAASLAVIFLTSSDTMINGYYRNYRGSFYAADSGINIIVEAMKDAVAKSAAPTTLSAAPLPISTAIPATNAMPASGLEAGALSAITTAYSPFQASWYSIGDNGSWNSQFKLISITPGQATYSVGPNTSDTNWATDGDYSWTFYYPYTITVQGQSAQSEEEELTESFTIEYSSSPGVNASGGLPSFASFGGFIDQYTLCDAGLVPGTMYGPFFTNGSWNFGNDNSPGYTFENSIGQAGSQVGYINGSCTKGGVTAPKGFTQPKFMEGFTIGDPPVTVPTDSYNQEQAVVNGTGAAACTANPCVNGDKQPPSATLMSTMQTYSGTQYSGSTASAGVYFPVYTVTNPTTGAQTLAYGSNTGLGGNGYGGGFYVNGNASVALSATTDTGGNPTQTYTISQSSGSGYHSTTTTTTIVVDTATNTTTVTQGSGTPLVLTGVPTQINPNTGAPMTDETDPGGDNISATMVYVNGTITGLSGTVQNATGVTITATSDIDVTGNVTYVSQPVTSNDTLVSNTNAGVLGIYTQGNLNLEPSSNGGNLTIDASIAMLSGNDSGMETPGNSVGTLTIMGGRSEDQAHGVNISTGNTLYDQRFAGSVAPPWFPTAVPTAGSPSVPLFVGATVQRTLWQQTSANQ